MKRYFGKFASSGDVQTAVENKELLNPYVAVVGNEVDYNSKEIDYASMPLTFEILSDGEVWMNAQSTTNIKQYYYSINGGNWVMAYSINSGDDYKISVHAGDKVRFKGDNSSYSSNYYRNNFVTTCTFEVYGNVMSLIDSTNYATLKSFTERNALQYLFYHCSGLTNVSNLVLPAVDLTRDCYGFMFSESNITVSPVLPASVLQRSCYASMFLKCASLSYIKCLATDLTATFCLDDWLKNVSATGTFVKKAGVSWPSGEDGIPTGWTVIEE